MARTAVVAGTATAVSGGVARRQQAKAQQSAETQAYPEQQMAPQPVAAAPDTSDMVEQLKELASLKDQGILTEEEFAAQKAKILGS
jgi:hypothetical protein